MSKTNITLLASVVSLLAGLDFTFQWIDFGPIFFHFGFTLIALSGLLLFSQRIRFGSYSGRLAMSALSLMLLLLFMYLWLMLWYDDYLPQAPRPSKMEVMFAIVCIVALWPFIVGAFFLDKDPPLWLMPLLWILTGLFWGAIVELVVIARRRLWPGKEKTVPRAGRNGGPDED